MPAPSWLTSVRDLFARRRSRPAVRRRGTLHRAEPLEARQVMAFDFVAAFPNFGQFITDGATLREAPQQITIRFSPGARVDPTTLGAISVVRAGPDGAFGGADDVNVTPTGFVGIVAVDDFPNENQVVLRFAENLPDDRYRLSIAGSLKTLANGPAAPAESFRNGGRLDLNFRLDLGAQVVSVVPQPVTRQANGSLSQARDTVVVYFNANDPLAMASAQNAGNYRLVETDPVTGDEVAVRLPQSVTYDTTDSGGRRTSRATLKFATDLGDKLFRLQIGGADDDNNTLAKATVVGTLFQVPGGAVGFSTNSFLGDGSAGVNDVDLYRVALPAGATLTTLVTPDAALRAAVRIFNAAGTQVASGTGTAAGAAVSVTYVAPTAGTYYVGISSFGNTAYSAVDGSNATGGTARGGYRIDLSSDATPSASDDNSSFATATGLGVLGLGGRILNAAIDVRPTVPTPLGALLFPSQPGTVDEPGHREIPLDLESHAMPAAELAPAGGADVVYYNFKTNYGFDGQGNPLVNAITETQKVRAREIFELYSLYTGIRCVETASSGLTVVTGDIRAVNPLLPVPNGPAGICGNGKAVMNGSLDWGQSEFGGRWYTVAMHEIGHALGLGHSYDIDSNMGGEAPAENVIPGDYDLVHLSVLHPRNGTDVDTYSFTLDADGKVTLETVVARPGQVATSPADTVLSLYREDPATGARELLSRNDDYYGRDSFIGMDLQAKNATGGRYTYYVAVTSTGTSFDPSIENSGAGGRTDGDYQLKMGYVPAAAALNTIVDATGTAIDGDRDGIAGGVFNSWFQSSTAANTIYVDKLAPAAGADGSLAKPFTSIAQGLAAAGAGTKVVRIVGNNLDTPATARPYLIGTDLLGQPLADGAEFAVPANVTVMIDEGAVLKLRAQNIDVGSATELVSRRGAAVQVLGTPYAQVQFTSYHDDTLGGDSDGVGPGRAGGQWGGIVLRGDSDSTTGRVFLNSISQAVMQYGGGQVRVNGQLQSFAPIHLESARPTLAFNQIRYSAGAAISADPNSFAETAARRGPAVRGNRLTDNSINGMFVRIRTQFGQPIDTLDLPAAFASRDVTYVLTENLLINGGVGGYDGTSGTVLARATGRLTIDPGVVVKLQGSRIELGRGNAQLIAEGDPQNRVIFTSARDNRFGGGGTFDVFGTGASQPNAGDWGGIVVNAATEASIDNAYIGYGGGQTTIEGGFDRFNAIEVHQGRLRLANSRIENNASGAAVTSRAGRGMNDAATIFVRGAQPVIVGNDFRNNAGAIVSINVNSLSDLQVPDPGRSTGGIARYTQYDDNSGPLVRSNTLSAVTGGVGGMVVRGGNVTTEGVWDDTDIVHVLTSEIVVDNFHTATGLRLMSSPNASLVVKLLGDQAGLTATGHAAEIDDRIGGTVQILGQPGYPVVLTSLKDDTVGASRDPLGVTVKDTNGDGPSTGAAGDWRGMRFLPYSNDRNVSVLRESEKASTGGVDANRLPVTAQYLGVLAPMEKGGDDNRRLGFEVHGTISCDDTTDVDVYSFDGYAGTEVWIDIDKTSATLDSMVELLDASGRVLARSADSQTDGTLSPTARGIGADLKKSAALGEDYYSTNPRDAGMRVVLPGTAGNLTQYFVRVRSQPQVASTASQATLETALTDAAQVRSGASSGRYELRLRLQQRDEKPGSTVRYADIRYPVVGIDVQGLPLHSPLAGENAETGANESRTEAQTLGNLLATDRNAISVAGVLSSAADVDWYAVDLAYEDIQAIGGVNAGLKTWATVFDIDYADGFRGDLTISVFNAQGQLMYVGRDSNVAADQPTPGLGNGFSDITKGSAGRLDPFIGSAQLPTGMPGAPQRYYVAISSNEQLPAVLDATFKSAATNSLVRLQPINSVQRAVEDHVGAQGYDSWGKTIAPTQGPMFDVPNLGNQVRPFTIDNVQLYLAEKPLPGAVYTPIGYQVDDLSMRSDGWLYAYTGVPGNNNTAGALSRTSIIGNGTFTAIGNDNIPNNVPATPFQETNLKTTNVLTVVPATTFQLSTANVTVNTPLDIPTLTGYVQYSATISGSPVTGTWSFTTASTGATTGALTFTSVDLGGAPAGLPYPQGGTVQSTGLVSITWSSPVTITNTGLNNNPTLSQVDYKVIPNPNADTTDRVDALAWHRRNDAANPGNPRYDFLYYSVRDVNTAGVETGVSRLYKANLTTGDAATGRVGGGTAVIQTTGNALGLTTGMSYVGDTLYGVDDQGNLFTINTATARATLVKNVGPSFQGLARGPQNVGGGSGNTPGYFADKLFGIDKDGMVYCFDTAGNAVTDAFVGGWSKFYGHDDGAGGVMPGNFTGLAFSPVDINLWRGTNVRSGDAGHGVMVPLDNTVDGASAQVAGGTSIYYGFDSSAGSAPDGTLLGHLRVVSAKWAEDLASGIGTSVANLPFLVAGTTVTGTTTAGSPVVTVGSTANLAIGMAASGAGIAPDTVILSINSATQITLSAPATASGRDVQLTFAGEGATITTLPFSLQGYQYTDKPTLYFNYRINSGEGSTTVKASTDGANWITIATNNHKRSPIDTADELLPAFTSVSSRIGWQPNQLVQELFENTGWRQARIDLGEFADDGMFAGGGNGTIYLKFSFTPSTDSTGKCEGIYVDDLMVGFAERGEVVTGAAANQTSFFTIGTPESGTTPKQNLEGAYQLEVRRGTEFGIQPDPAVSLVQVHPAELIDTNDDLVRGIANPFAGLLDNIRPGAQYRGDDNNPRDQGQFIIESNAILAAAMYGIRIDAAAREAGTDAPLPGAVRNVPVLNNNRLVPGVVVINNIVSTSGQAGILFSGDTNSGSGATAPVPFGRIVNNTIYGGALASSQAVPVRFDKLTGVAATATSVYRTDLATPLMPFKTISSITIRDNSALLASGNGKYTALDLDAIKIATTLTADATQVAGLPSAATFDFTSAGTTLVAGAQRATTNPLEIGPLQGTLNGAVDNTSATLGIFDAVTTVGPTSRGFVSLGDDGTITFTFAQPIVVSGPLYLYVGEAGDVGELAASTILVTGDLNSTGILVTDNAGPTLLNNLFSTLATAVSVDASSAVNADGSQRTVVGTSAFHNVVNQVAGAVSDKSITLSADPFVNAARGNFYLVSGTSAIDSSLDVLQERTDYAAVISPLGIPVSPIIAPARDLYGQLRDDDPLQASPPGLGAAVFKDRGAVDRVDFTSPSMALATPLDGSQTAPVDRDPAANSVRLERGDATSVTRFVLQLNDIGVGLDKTTVVSDAFRVVRDGTVTLQPGVDYLFRFLETANQVVLESASVFPLGQYVITATSRPASGGTAGLLTDLANNKLAANQTDGTTQFRIALVDAPGAPTGVTGVAGDRQVALAWQAPTTGGGGITDYVIEYSTDGGANWTTYTDGVSTATSATVTGLTNGTTYIFHVAAVNVVGLGSFSAATVPLMPSAPAGAPTAVTGVPGDRQVALSWTAPTNTGGTAIVDYIVQYRVNVAGSTWTTFADGTSTAPNTTVTGLTNGTAYVFRVAAVNGAAAGAYSVESAPVTPRTLPSAPTNLVATRGDGRVSLTWAAPASNGGLPITDYVVQFSSNGGTSWTTFTDGTSTATNATVTGLTNGTAYVFRVAAVTGAGTGPYTAASAPVTPVALPSAPTILTATRGDRQVALTWSVPTSNGGLPITDYVVQFSSNGGTSWTTFADGTSTATSATVTGLTNGTGYIFRVAAVTAVGTGGFSTPSATIRPFASVPAPTGLTAVGGNGQVTVSWIAPVTTQALTDYVIQFRPDVVGSAWQTFADGVSTATRAVVTGLTNGTRYFFRVAAVSSLGQGVFSDGTLAATPVTAPTTAPTSVRGQGSLGVISLLWNAPVGSTGPVVNYVIQYRDNVAGSVWQTLTIRPTTTSATITGLTNRLGYFFRVAAANGAGVGPWSDSSALIRPY